MRGGDQELRARAALGILALLAVQPAALAPPPPDLILYVYFPLNDYKLHEGRAFSVFIHCYGSRVERVTGILVDSQKHFLNTRTRFWSKILEK